MTAMDMQLLMLAAARPLPMPLVMGAILAVLTCALAFMRVWTTGRGFVRTGAAGLPGEHHRFYEALISGSRQALVILGPDAKFPVSFGRGAALLRDCLAGPDAAVLAPALDALLKTGASFVHAAHTPDGRTVAVRGMPVGRRAVVYFRDRGVKMPGPSFRELADALPMPVWTRKPDLSLAWGNRAFMAAVGAGALENDPATDVARWEQDLASATRRGGPAEAERDVLVGGRPRTLNMTLLPAAGGSIVGIAADVTGRRETETRLRLAGEALADVIEMLPLGVAVFDAQQKLVIHNSRYARLWGLAKDWLDTHPSYGEILDRLRACSRLPEQKDYTSWKRRQLASAEAGQELWHLRGGHCLNVVTRPHLQGGRVVMFEDVSERLVLETSLNLLIQVQKATLDTLDEGTAIFGPNGRLVLHNDHFASLWGLTAAQLSEQPHLTEIARLCMTRFGADEIWAVIAEGVTSLEPNRRYKWRKVRRADGRTISLSLARLPNGATIVLFIDLTDLERFEALQRETALSQLGAKPDGKLSQA
ncbi:MAG TPA: PAS-domain containing protein [Rhizomicrobium sp.]|nr:PAS-domain containing protein [Rhizomicrobium sp.]